MSQPPVVSTSALVEDIFKAWPASQASSPGPILAKMVASSDLESPQDEALRKFLTFVKQQQDAASSSGQPPSTADLVEFVKTLSGTVSPAYRGFFDMTVKAVETALSRTEPPSVATDASVASPPKETPTSARKTSIAPIGPTTSRDDSLQKFIDLAKKHRAAWSHSDQPKVDMLKFAKALSGSLPPAYRGIYDTSINALEKIYSSADPVDAPSAAPKPSPVPPRKRRALVIASSDSEDEAPCCPIVPEAKPDPACSAERATSSSESDDERDLLDANARECLEKHRTYCLKAMPVETYDRLIASLNLPADPLRRYCSLYEQICAKTENFASRSRMGMELDPDIRLLVSMKVRLFDLDLLYPSLKKARRSTPARFAVRRVKGQSLAESVLARHREVCLDEDISDERYDAVLARYPDLPTEPFERICRLAFLFARDIKRPGYPTLELMTMNDALRTLVREDKTLFLRFSKRLRSLEREELVEAKKAPVAPKPEVVPPVARKAAVPGPCLKDSTPSDPSDDEKSVQMLARLRQECAKKGFTTVEFDSLLNDADFPDAPFARLCKLWKLVIERSSVMRARYTLGEITGDDFNHLTTVFSCLSSLLALDIDFKDRVNDAMHKCKIATPTLAAHFAAAARTAPAVEPSQPLDPLLPSGNLAAAKSFSAHLEQHPTRLSRALFAAHPSLTPDHVRDVVAVYLTLS